MLTTVLKTIFMPIKGISYLEQYTKTMSQLLVHKNRKLKLLLKLINLGLFFKAIHFAYLSAAKLTDFERTLHGDNFFVIIRKKSFINLLSAYACFLAIYLNLHLFTKTGNLQLSLFLYDIVNKKKRDFFTTKTTKKGLPIWILIKRCYLFVLNLFVSAVFANGEIKISKINHF